ARPRAGRSATVAAAASRSSSSRRSNPGAASWPLREKDGGVRPLRKGKQAEVPPGVSPARVVPRERFAVDHDVACCLPRTALGVDNYPVVVALYGPEITIVGNGAVAICNCRDVDRRRGAAVVAG